MTNMFAATLAGMDKSQIEHTFATAKSNGFEKMKLRYANLVFSLAGAASFNAGSIYVKTDDGTYLGKIRYNQFKEGHGVILSAEDRLNIRWAMDNPRQAAVRYGAKTGACSICGRQLTASESVANKIGPICAEKFGFFHANPLEDL
jgi:hypothetical protein